MLLGKETIKAILEHIYYFRCTDSIQLVSTVCNLNGFLQNHKNV